MAGRYAIAIVGSGPGGLSAAGRAAELGTPHILLESAGWASDTIYKYQKGKHVMATPDVLPLRSPFSFAAGTREQVLGAWDGALESLNVNIRHNAEVTAIKGEKGNFELTLRTGDVIAAEHVVLAIGLQGNLRKLEVPGADQPFVQYQLDDPEEYEDEYIIVIGAGDAAIENALALAKQNSVTIVNRRDEFARAKDGNLSLMTEAIDKGVIECMYNSAPKEIGADFMVLSTAEGEATIACNRVIARLGAIPPRRFVESCGVEFPSDDIMALPQLSSHYESNIPGLYLIGALGGYPLIKQAMNQGYEVVEFILGNDVKPADEPLLEAKFDALGDIAVDEVLERIRSHVPILSGLTTLQLREFMIDSDVHTPGAGDVVFQRNEYTNSFFTIVDGLVAVQVNPEDPDDAIRLGTGEFFGEMGLISGRRRTATVVAEADCFLIETPRRSMIKLINSVEAVKRVMDQTAMARQIQTNLAPEIPTQEFSEVVETATIQTFASGQTLFVEGDEGESIYLIRRGSVTVARRIGDRDVVLYLRAGRPLRGRDGAVEQGAALGHRACRRRDRDGGARGRRVPQPARAQAGAARATGIETAGAVDRQCAHGGPAGLGQRHRVPRQSGGRRSHRHLADRRIALRALRQLRKGVCRDAWRHLPARPRGRTHVRRHPCADQLPPLRAPALHVGLPRRRHPPRAQRRGVHR